MVSTSIYHVANSQNRPQLPVPLPLPTALTSHSQQAWMLPFSSGWTAQAAWDGSAQSQPHTSDGRHGSEDAALSNAQPWKVLHSSHHAHGEKTVVGELMDSEPLLLHGLCESLVSEGLSKPRSSR